MSVAFVTGSAIRIGRATARALAEAGFDLALHAHGSADKLAPLKAELEQRGRTVHCFTGDLATEDGVSALARAVANRFPALDALVHNAGIFERVAFGDITRAQYRRTMAINLDAPFFLTQGLLPQLRAAPSPCVVHVTDIGGERALSHYAHYGVSKAGLLMLTRQLAVELAPHVRVNAVSPGTVAFPEDFTPEQRASVLRRVPLAREGTVEDIARAVVFLVTAAPYVTGQVLAVDGGRSAAL
ncbi:MAG: SDR family oxidoreductase [Deltaproteobacteria bacterium]|nr:SDR family oxidoreductase [Deltaproteobacteria bacterium]